MATVNVHYINPFLLSEDWMEFDIELSGGISWRGAKTFSLPKTRDDVVSHATALVSSLASEESPLELGTVTIDQHPLVEIPE